MIPGDPQISIVTPTRNRRDALLRAIRSVRAQTVTEFEHIVIDDGSTDGTSDAVAGIADPRIVYVALNTWSGANEARNHGIALARAPIVTFLDSDDEYLPHRLETTLKIFALHRDLKLMISSFQTMKRGQTLDSRNPNGMVSRDVLERTLVAHSLFIAGSAITARRDPILAVGGFDPEIRRLQDRDLLLRLARHSGAFLAHEMDWIKHASVDSISARPDGFVEAYSELARKHPGMLETYPDLVKYIVARRVLMNLMRGRLLQGSYDYLANRRSRMFRFGLVELVRGYVRGKQQRRRIKRELAADLKPVKAVSLEPRPSPLLSGS